MPEDNTAAGLPGPEIIIGNYVARLGVNDGVIEISLGNRSKQKALGYSASPCEPIAWVYAFASVPNGMAVIGQNTSTVEPRHRPVNCRY